MKFKVGDRVAVYTWQGKGIGCVERVGESTHIDVRCADGSLYNDVHPKQCRLLKKKERRRKLFLVNYDNPRCGHPNIYYDNLPDNYTGDFIKRFVQAFVKVKKK